MGCIQQVRSLTGKSKEEINSIWNLAVEVAGTSNEAVTGRLVKRILKRGGLLGAVAAHRGLGSLERGRVVLSSESCCWYTPLILISLVRALFGGCISLDPCSDALAQVTVQALRFFSVLDNGLLSRNIWEGTVFCNPPFGKYKGKSIQGLFFERGVREFEAGRIKEAVFLLKAAVGYVWFAQVLRFPHTFLDRRVQFYNPENTHNGSANPHGTVVVYLGRNVAKFCETFQGVGWTPGFNSWSA